MHLLFIKEDVVLVFERCVSQDCFGVGVAPPGCLVYDPQCPVMRCNFDVLI